MLGGAPSIGRAEAVMCCSSACEGEFCCGADDFDAGEYSQAQCFFRYAPFPVIRACDAVFPFCFAGLYLLMGGLSPFPLLSSVIIHRRYAFELWLNKFT